MSILPKLDNLNESENIIFNVLLKEAEDKIRERIKKGKKQEDAIKEVSDEFGFNDDEVESVNDLFINPEKPLSTKDNPYPNSIYFNDGSDIDKATGVLMYSNIPWNAKGDGDSNFIQFANQDTLAKAMKSLGNKWDFVDNKKDNVATISFDNINDYKKVLDFISQSGMFISFDDTQDLDEDAGQLEKEKPIDYNGRSFVAKDKKIKEKIEPTKNKNQRSSVIRKRFR